MLKLIKIYLSAFLFLMLGGSVVFANTKTITISERDLQKIINKSVENYIEKLNRCIQTEESFTNSDKKVSSMIKTCQFRIR